MTVTSNIHFGITAWTNHSFALAERCSNAGNAYQCTTAGSSTAAPTGTGSSISPGGGAVFKWLSVIDKSDIDTWIASIPGTPSQPYVGLLWNDAPISTSTWVKIVGHSTTSTNNVTLKCAPGESFADNPNSSANPLYPSASYGVQISRPLNYDFILECSDDFSVFDGLQLVQPIATQFFNAVLMLTNNQTFTRCIMRGWNPSNSNQTIIRLVGSSSTVLTLANCVVLDMQPSGTNSPGLLTTNSNLTMTNCIYHAVNGTTADAFRNLYGGSTLTVTNTIQLGYGAFSNTNWGTMVARNNLTDLASYPAGWTDTGAATKFSKTAANQFVGVGSNYKLKTGADAINAGFTDTTHIPSATDIYGTSRPQGAAWDIGPHELVSAGPPPYRARVVRWG